LHTLRPVRKTVPRLLVRSRFGEEPGPVARLKHVYELRGVLDSSWATRPLSFVRQDGSDALLLDDPGGEVLSTLVGRPWELRPFLRVAIGIADALRHLHEHGIMHKDVKPAHILVDAGTGKAWLTGFGIASMIPRDALPDADRRASFQRRRPDGVDSLPRRQSAQTTRRAREGHSGSGLAETGGKVSGPSGAAAKLGMPAQTLYSKISSMKIDRHRFKRG
jgi:serine/threonine protein kinase